MRHYPDRITIELYRESGNRCNASAPSGRHGGEHWRVELRVFGRATKAFLSVPPTGRQFYGCDRHALPMALHLIAEIVGSDALREAVGLKPEPKPD